MDLVSAMTAYVLATCDATRVEVVETGVHASLERRLQSVSLHGDPCRDRPSLNATVDLDEGETAHIGLRPSLRIWTEAWTTPAATDAGEIFVAEMREVLLERRRGTLVEQSGPWLALTHLAEGQPVTENRVTLPPDALSGQQVDVRVIQGGVTLVAKGQLLEHGRIGDRVRVKNDFNHLAQAGILVSPTAVEVR